METGKGKPGSVIGAILSITKTKTVHKVRMQMQMHTAGLSLQEDPPLSRISLPALSAKVSEKIDSVTGDSRAVS
jgi:hypothetical protein